MIPKYLTKMDIEKILLYKNNLIIKLDVLVLKSIFKSKNVKNYWNLYFSPNLRLKLFFSNLNNISLNFGFLHTLKTNQNSNTLFNSLNYWIVLALNI
jgi:hypothetical protein